MVQSRRARHLRRARDSLPSPDPAEQSSSAASNSQTRADALQKLHHEFGIIQQRIGQQQQLLSQQNGMLTHMQNQWDSLQRHELGQPYPSSSGSNVDASLQRLQQQFGINEQRPPIPQPQRPPRSRVPQPHSTPLPYTSPPTYPTTPRLPAYRSAAPTPELKPFPRLRTPERALQTTPQTLPIRSTPRTEHRAQSRTTQEELLATPTRRRTPAGQRVNTRPPRFNLDALPQFQDTLLQLQQDIARLHVEADPNAEPAGPVEEEPAVDEDREVQILEQTEQSNIFYYNATFRGQKLKPKRDCAREPLEIDRDVRHILGRMDSKCVAILYRPPAANVPRCPHCSALHWVEERTSGTTKAHPEFSCCMNGEVFLPVPAETPPELWRLLTETQLRQRDGVTRRTKRCADFHKIIRHVNNAFSFCSLGSTWDTKLANANSGTYTFQNHGQLYHNIGSLHAGNAAKPCYAQLYIFDGEDEQMERRADYFHNIPADIMQTIHDMLHRHHPYVQFFKQNAQRIRSDRTMNLQLSIITEDGKDPRRYNRPTVREVAVLLPNITSVTQGRHVVLENHEGTLHRISEYKAQYQALRYAILFPLGDQGWYSGIPLRSQPRRPQPADAPDAEDAEAGEEAEVEAAQNEDNAAEEQEEQLEEDGVRQPRRGRGKHGSTRVSQRQWYCYHLQTREVLTPLLLASRLFHEWIVDAFAAVEANRLNYFRQNQAELRVAHYSGMLDALSNNNAVAAGEIGIPIILPSTHMGSPRQMRAAYHDAMAIVRHFGSPDFFITITCNPRWIEITRELKHGQMTQDAPNLQNRVFRQKLKELLREITQCGVLGRVVAHCYTIEFQKRGLPHAHILIIMHPDSRLKTTEDIDATIRADLPVKEDEPLLHDVVTRFMLHAACGEAKPNASCTRDGDPYVYTSRDIAPYNAYLCLRFNCHINVQYVAGFTSVKYVYKYVYKGNDQAMLRVASDGSGVQRVDEILDYIDARYVAAHEAHWRIIGFKTHARSPSVVMLAVHLENEQIIGLQGNESVADIAAREKSRRTTLTEYFAMNHQYKQDAARGLTAATEFNSTLIKYQDFPQHCRWDKANKRWNIRKRGFAIGRIAWVSLTRGELHYLRLLLTQVSGQVGYKDTRTIEGVELPTFRAACSVLGLLQDDVEYEQALEEASSTQLGRQPRELFVTILIHCSPGDPCALWEKFKDQLADDCGYALRNRFDVRDPTQQDIHDLALCYIRVNLQRQNTDLLDFALPLPVRDFMRQIETERNRLLRVARDYDVDEQHTFFEDALPRMNTDQLSAFGQLDVAIQAGQGGVFFVDGPGGTGKTFLQKALLAKVRSQGKIALAVASTGIAATLLPGGTTAHSRFKIPIPVGEGDACAIDKSSHLAELLTHTDLVFWDEAVMHHRFGMEAVERSMRDIRGNDLLFGGIVFCFCGDFRQTLPVVPGASRSQVVSACFRRSPLWRHVKTLPLRVNMRLQRPGMDDIERENVASFAQRLLSVGERTGEDRLIQWPTSDVVLGNSIATLANEIYPGIGRQIPTPDQLRTCAILTPKNDGARAINNLLLEDMVGAEFFSLSADTPKETDSGAPFPIEFLNSIELPGLPPHKLRLKVGCTVILLRNLDPGRGLCNGTRLYVQNVQRRLLSCTILGGEYHGNLVQLPRIPLASPESLDGLEFTRQQWPVKLAFAMTINKSQGQSLDRVGLVLDPEVFSHGQLYVALSRVTSATGIRMVVPNKPRAIVDGRLTNVVFEEVFRD